MNLKKIKILGVFSIFGLCFLLHFIYNWIPNSVLAIFVPVNESIWEHMKLIPTSFILWGIIDFILLKKYENFNNFLLQLFLVPVIGIIIYLLIYLPLYNIFGENMIISIILLFIVIIIEQILSYIILSKNEIKYQGIIGILGIITMYIIFGYLTYNPIINYIFFDTKDNKYGINTYIFE
ncbi:MAG: hypothetical protein J6B98_00300 [Bacilli bacterium]|nr:hypothetical protein [Bacilli bacterium]